MEEKKPRIVIDASQPDYASTIDSRDGQTHSATDDLHHHSGSSKIQTFRKKIWIFQTFVIMGVTALCIAQLVTTNKFFGDSKEINASVALDITREKVDLQAFIVGKLAEHRLGIRQGILHEFLKFGNQSQEVLRAYLRKKTDEFWMEVNTIVDVDGNIAASAYDMRIGQRFDPKGIVTKHIERYQQGDTSLEYVLELAELSSQEFKEMNAPHFVSSDSDYYAVAYTLRKQKSGLIIFATASILDADGSLLGVSVVGHVLNGKYDILERCFKRIGKDSIIGTFHKKDSEWFTDQYLESQVSFESRNTRLFDNFELLEEVLALDSESRMYGDFINFQGKEYTYAAAPLFKNISKRGSANAVIIVGTLNEQVDASLDTTLVALIAFLIGTVLLILFLVVLSFRLFLDPLEVLVKEVKRKELKQIEKQVVKVQRSRNLIWAVGLAVIAVSGLLAGMLGYNYQRVASNFVSQSSAFSKLQIMNLFYRRLTWQYYVDSGELSILPDFIGLVTGNATDYIDNVQEAIDNYVQENKLHLLMVLDNQKRIVVSSSADVRGREFDHKGIISEVLERKAAIRANVLFNNSEYLSLDPESFVESRFLPQNSGDMVAVRIIAYPIFAPGSSIVNGVLLYGRMLNGNPVSLTVRFVKEYGGCAGVYYADSNGDATLIASAFQSDKVPLEYDTDLATPELLQLVKRSATTNGYVSEPSIEILGEDWEVSVDRLFPGSEFGTNGGEKLSRRFDDPIFVAQCSSRSRWSYLVQTMASISFVTFFGNLIASSVLAYLTFKPIYDFCTTFENQWKRNRKPSSPFGKMTSVWSDHKGGSSVEIGPKSSSQTGVTVKPVPISVHKE